MKLISNKEWAAIQEYVAQLKKQQARLEGRLSNLVLDNANLSEQLEHKRKNDIATKTELEEQVFNVTKENLSLKATLEECLEILNQVSGTSQKVGLSNLLDIKA